MNMDFVTSEDLNDLMKEDGFGVELTFKKRCAECPAVELELVDTPLHTHNAILHSYRVRCVHQKVCKQLCSALAKEWGI